VRVDASLRPEQRAVYDEAMTLAGKLLGATSPRWQRLESMCEEFLGARPAPAPEDDADEVGSVRWPVASGRLERLKEILEEEFSRWSFLEDVSPVSAPQPPNGAGAQQLDAELRRLAALRDRWDEVLGRLAMLLQTVGLWRDMKFASFGHYCAERLGMAARTVEQRAWLDRRLHALPRLRQALREGRVTYEKARLVAGCADDAAVDRWIARAERTTCIALRREIEAEHNAQMCARGDLTVRVPHRVGKLVGAAFAAARAAAGRWLSPGECLARIAEHFLATWKDALRDRSTLQRRVLERDRGECQVPGCSRAAVHAHHVVFRSRGGADAPRNLVSLCAAHHLHGIHAGYLQVRGEAPHALAWALAAPPAAVH
jgi:hypothetical protein